MDERGARMALAARELPDGVRRVAIEDAVGVWERVGADYPGPDLDELMEATLRVGARFVIPGDDEWPDKMNNLVDRDRPLGLWVAGPGTLNPWRSIAIVGSRSSTAYGEHVASQMAVDLAEDGVVVVSGGAYGIDASAHRGALSVQGVTMSVMAGGVGQAYPVGNGGLLDRIKQTGLLVSEVPPDTPPTRARFLRRNRFIAALSDGTVVVEAAKHSGALHIAEWAHELGRPLLAVPGPVTSSLSVGPHGLIREGIATLAMTSDEVMDTVQAAVWGAPETIPEAERAHVWDVEPSEPRDMLLDHQDRIL